MRPTTAPARDMAEAKVRVLELLREAVDARWIDEYQEEGADIWRTAEKSVLEEMAALLGAAPEEIRACNRHTLCPIHSAHACVFCLFACAHCYVDFATWKVKHEPHLPG